MFQFGLDQEAADLIAARAVREGMAAWPCASCVTIEELIASLLSAGALDRDVARYVLTHPDRFSLSLAPLQFEARWCIAGTRVAC